MKYRDVATLVGFGVQLLLFATPIAYPPELVPPGWRTVLYLNPLSGAVGLLRWALVDTASADGRELATSVGAAVVAAPCRSRPLPPPRARVRGHHLMRPR